MIDKECDIRPIGYGAMLMEGLVGVMALIAACALHPGDYFAINTPPAVFADARHAPPSTCRSSRRKCGETVAGRTGGAVSLAVGMAQIFSGLPGMRGLMDYWYHFAIMFEALFILTTIDAGTRVGRFLVQEFLGRVVHAARASRTGCPGRVRHDGADRAGVGATSSGPGSINTIWPMFGIANQLLAVGRARRRHDVIINMGQAKYAWVTLVPLLFLSDDDADRRLPERRDNFWPLAIGAEPGAARQGYVRRSHVDHDGLVVIILAPPCGSGCPSGRTGRDTEALGELA